MNGRLRRFLGGETWRLGALLVVVALAYRPAWHGAAVFDDDDHLTPPELASAAGLARIWAEPGAVSQYYPVTHSAFWVMNRLWGHDPTGYHAVNLALHALAAWLFGRWLARLAVPGAWFAAAVFALHPVHVESVAWISELKNTLSAVLVLAAAGAYRRFDETRDRGAYAGALAWFLAALLAKSVTAVLPAAWLVVVWWRRGRIEWRRDVAPLVPCFVLGAAAGLATAWIERKFIGAEGADFALGAAERVLVAGRAAWFYLGKLLWPAELAFVYPRWTLDAGSLGQWAWPVAAAATLGLAWAVRRRTRGPLAAALLFGGTLFPVLGFLNVYPFVYAFVADHYQYLASLAAIAAVVAGAVVGTRLAPVAVRAAAPWVGAGLLAGLATLTWRQSRMYADAETLWRTTLARNDGAFVAHANLANVLLERGRGDEALAHARRAVELRPGFAQLHSNLGHVLLSLGRAEAAAPEFRRAAELRPTLAPAHFNLAVVHLRAGRADEARAALERAVKHRPDYVAARALLGGLSVDAGDAAGALAILEPARAVRPDDAAVNANLGNALLRLDRAAEAEAHYRRALAAAPDDAAVHFNRAAALGRLGRGTEARAALERAVALQPEFAAAQAELGRLLVEQGRPAAALAPLRRAVAAAPADAVALNALGVALMQTGDARAATECFRAAVRAAPDFGLARDNLARALELFPAASTVP